MTPEEQAVALAEMARQAFEPPMKVTSEYAGALLKLIVDQGTLKMKSEALDLSVAFMARMGEWT